VEDWRPRTAREANGDAVPEPLPDRTVETVAWPRETIGAHAAAAHEYEAASAQARRDDSFLKARALNFDLEGFTLPNESQRHLVGLPS
jgi:hypothetical protein